MFPVICIRFIAVHVYVRSHKKTCTRLPVPVAPHSTTPMCALQIPSTRVFCGTVIGIQSMMPQGFFCGNAPHIMPVKCETSLFLMHTNPKLVRIVIKLFFRLESVATALLMMCTCSGTYWACRNRLCRDLARRYEFIPCGQPNSFVLCLPWRTLHDSDAINMIL
jgi:hypothetical protein